MKIRKPDYYDRFQCIAGACSDSCCIGWEIDVDEERLAEYREVDGELGERLKTCMDWEEGHFILQGKEERCPFLNQENLCDLIIGLGEESLCEICREHPRFYEWYDDLTEVGVGLCCEAAARLVLEGDRPAQFVVHEDYDAEDSEELEDTEDAEDADTLQMLFQARETAFAILQNRTRSIWERLSRFITYIEELQEGLDFGNLDEIEESAEYYRSDEWTEEEPEFEYEQSAASIYAGLIGLCRELEAIDESWPATLDSLEELLSDAGKFCKLAQEMLEANHAREYEYEHLAVYFVYRYFMKCRSDGDLFSKGMLAIFCILLIRLLDVAKFAESRTLTKEDRVQNAKTCSKEIEYSEENLETLA